MSESEFPAPADESCDAIAHLRALGYVDPEQSAAERAAADRRLAARLECAVQLLGRRQYAEALQEAEAAVAADVQAIAPRRLLAETLFRAGRVAEAREQLLWLEHHGVERGDVALLRARVEAAQRRGDAALDWAQYAAHLLGAEAPQAYLVAADVHRRRRQFAAAERCYLAALDHPGSAAEAQLGLGALETTRGEALSALPWLLQAVEADFARAESHAWLGRALMRMERWDEARVALQTALKLAPQLSGPKRWLSQIDPL